MRIVEGDKYSISQDLYNFIHIKKGYIVYSFRRISEGHYIMEYEKVDNEDQFSEK